MTSSEQQPLPRLEIAEFEHAWHDGGTPVSPAPIIDAIEPLLARLARP